MMERRCPGTAGLPGRAYPPPPFIPSDYWATRKWVSAHVGAAMSALSARLLAAESSLTSLDARVRAVETAPAPLAGRRLPLRTNGDLYVALAAIVPALGGEVAE